MPVREERHVAAQARRDGTSNGVTSAHLPDDDLPVYPMSVAAERTGLHPQTLRGYDRAGLVSPRRSEGGNRLYSSRDVARLRYVDELSTLGINHEGIRRILALESEVSALAHQLRQALRQVYADRAAQARGERPGGPVVVRHRGEVEKWCPPRPPGTT